MTIITKTRAAIAATVLAVGVASFAGTQVAGAKPKPTNPSQVKAPAAPKLTPPKGEPDEHGHLRVDFEQQGKALGLSGDKLKGFVERSEKIRADKEKEDDAARARGETPSDDVMPARP
jgi:hypothetical protein